MAYGDLNGSFHVVNLGKGTSLYTYKTGSLVTSSPADVDGNLLIASEDGFLYDFGVGGGNGSAPTTAVTSPAGGPVVESQRPPDHQRHGLGARRRGRVTVQVQEGGSTGPWFDQGADTFGSGLSDAQATLGSPGQTPPRGR